MLKAIKKKKVKHLVTKLFRLDDMAYGDVLLKNKPLKYQY